MEKIELFGIKRMASNFDRWEKDPFFSAAEEVQESADRYTHGLFARLGFINLLISQFRYSILFIRRSGRTFRRVSCEFCVARWG